jgi:outer membrane receptor protein involved in Fe transport
VTYDIDKNNMVFASVSTGYKSGGLQDGGRPYGAETLTNYEVGSKSTFLGGKVRMNNSAYYSKFKDFQFSAPVTNPDGTRGRPPTTPKAPPCGPGNRDRRQDHAGRPRAVHRRLHPRRAQAPDRRQ